MPIPWVSLAIYGATALTSHVFKGKKRPNSPIYKTSETNEDYWQERRVPLVYGHCKVRGTVVYREDKDGALYDMAVAFCEGPIEEIGKVTLDDVIADELEGLNAITRYLGTSDQAADAIMAEGVYRITATADAYVDADNPTTNYDGEKLWVLVDTGDTPKRYSYLKFDPSELPAGLTVEEAWLEMTPETDISGQLVLKQLATESWEEDTITWNTKPSPGSAISGALLSGAKYGKWGRNHAPLNSAGISYLQTQYNAGTTCSLVITGDTYGQVGSWTSKEGVYPSPKLCIRFSGGDASAFRNTAYVALTVDTDDEQISSHIPAATAEVKGKQIANWDESGSAWQTTYCVNPAWVLYHYLTNTRSGSGVSSSRLNTDTFKSVASYCDTEVTVDGETGPRFECHVNLDDRRTGDDDVQDILATFGGYIYQQDGLLCIGVEKADSPDTDFDFDDSSIIAGSFSYWQADRERIPNVVRVLYTDPEKDFVKTHAQAEDVIDIEDRGRVMKEVPIYGINSRSQAARMAQYVLYKGLKVRWGCTFRVGINHCHISPGIIVTVTKEEAGWTNKQFRVIEISESDRDEIEVTCEEYVASLYNDDGGPGDYNEQPVILDGDAAPLVTALSATETYEIGNDGTYQPQIQVAFTRPSNAYYLKYIIWLKEDGGSYVFKANVTSSPYIINVTKYTDYTVRVTTHNSLSQKESVYADSPTDTVTVAGQDYTPSVPNVTGIEWTTDSRAEWTTGSIYYKGVTYAINSGNTTSSYIYFDPDISATTLQTASSVPSFGTNGFIVATYDGTTDEVHPVPPVRVLHAGLLMVGTILARPYQTAATGARLEIFPDANTGIQIIDDASNDVFKAVVGGANVGDVIIGDYAGGQGMMYDKSAGAFHVRGDLDVTSVNWSDVVDDGGKPDNNADVTGSNIAAGITGQGDLATLSVVEAAKLGTSVISGGYIATSLLTADNIQAGTLQGRTVQTSASGKRTVISGTDNNIILYNSSGGILIRIDDTLWYDTTPGIEMVDDNPHLYMRKSDNSRYSDRTTWRTYIESDVDGNIFEGIASASLTNPTAIFRAKINAGLTGNFIAGHLGSTFKYQVDQDGKGIFVGGAEFRNNVSITTGYIDVAGGYKESGNIIITTDRVLQNVTLHSGIALPAAQLTGTINSARLPDLSATYAVASKGVTNGDSHNHVGGDGGTISIGSIYADDSVPGAPTKVFGWTASYGYGLYTL